MKRENIMLKCTNDYCTVTARDNSKERGRFLRRHPRLCTGRHEFAKQLASDVRSVETSEKGTNYE